MATLGENVREIPLLLLELDSHASAGLCSTCKRVGPDLEHGHGVSDGVDTLDAGLLEGAVRLVLAGRLAHLEPKLLGEGPAHLRHGRMGQERLARRAAVLERDVDGGAAVVVGRLKRDPGDLARVRLPRLALERRGDLLGQILVAVRVDSHVARELARLVRHVEGELRHGDPVHRQHARVHLAGVLLVRLSEEVVEAGGGQISWETDRPIKYI